MQTEVETEAEESKVQIDVSTKEETTEEAKGEAKVDVKVEVEEEKKKKKKEPQEVKENGLAPEEKLAPVFASKPEPSSVKEGETIKLECQVTGKYALRNLTLNFQYFQCCCVCFLENAEISWTKDGKKLKPKKKEKRLKIDVNTKTNVSTLEIEGATLEDSGEYAVVAENAEGVSSCTVSVKVVSKVEKVPPQFTLIPKPVLVKEGENIEITCKITGKKNSFWFEIMPSRSPWGLLQVSQLQRSCALKMGR